MRSAGLGLLFLAAATNHGAPVLAQAKPGGVPPVAEEEQYRETQDLIERLQNRISVLDESSTERAQDIAAFNAKIKEVLAILSEQKEESEDLEAEVSVLGQLLALERERTAELRGEIDEISAQLKAANAGLLKTAGALRKAGDQLKAAQAAAAINMAKVVEAQAAAAKHKAAAAKHKAAAAENKARAAAIEKARRAQVGRVEILNKEISELKKRLREMQNRRTRRRR